MFNTTLPFLKCPRRKRGHCGGSLELAGAAEGLEIRTGTLTCQTCKAKFPILAGVAILVDDVRDYLLGHVKGISKIVPDSEIPSEYRREFLEAKAEIQIEHIEDDLESERVNALYLMNHYLHVEEKPADAWWKPSTGTGSPVIADLVREHWNKGPFAQIKKWVAEFARDGSAGSAVEPWFACVELGCGVGGLYTALKPHLKSYLGIDSAFASVALARHLALGMPYRGSLKMPGDLLQGPVSRELKILPAKTGDGTADFVVGDLENPPLKPGVWDIALALNAIDMLEEPSVLPDFQFQLLKKRGVAISSCPYIWHEAVAKKLRAKLPREITDSSRAVEWLYEKAGFTIREKIEHLPWLFFKHLRQIEVYSVHLFAAGKTR